MDSNLNSLENYEILLVRYACVVAQNLLNRIERMLVCNLNLLPHEKSVIAKKRRMTENKFVYNAKGSNLLAQLDFDDIKVSSELMDLLNAFKDSVTKIGIYLIAREAPKSKKGLLLAEAYLTQEECMLQVKKKDDLTTTMIAWDSKCRNVMLTVIKFTDCYNAFNDYLLKKETSHEWVAYRRLLLKNMEHEFPSEAEEVSDDDYGDSEYSDEEIGSDFAEEGEEKKTDVQEEVKQDGETKKEEGEVAEAEANKEAENKEAEEDNSNQAAVSGLESIVSKQNL